MKIITDEKRIEEILTRGVHDIFGREELKKKLLSGKKLHVKLGTDVTGRDLHLGHSVIHRKLRDLQELGHQVTLIIGDFTTIVGDHSDKVDMRNETNEKEIAENEKTYKSQFFKTVFKEGTKIRHNSEWLNKLTIKKYLFMTKAYSIQQMFDRETFKKRFNEEKKIGFDEWSYPILQGYDSVILKCDLELGGTDQTFNLLAGRKLMPLFGVEPQSAIAMKLLLGSDGKPMGKSLQNYIPIVADSDNMYGGVMSIVDDVIFDYFELVTRVPMNEIEKMKVEVKKGENPMKFKKILAKEIVSFYHGEKKAEEAQKNWENIFSKKEIPEEMEEINCSGGELLSEVLVKNKIIESKSEWKRLILGNGVHDLEKNKTITDLSLKITENLTLKIGKKRFVKIIKK
ncbi:MAG: tyrosine--tRNA ligase [Candidatus Paceibacterota bacterium]|jgi:tyrosyl-tRNA synthetase